VLKDIPVKNYMSQYVLTFSPEQEVLEAAKMLADRGIHSAPVMDNIGNLVGVLSDTDCMAVAIKVGYEPDFKGLVKEYMSDNPVNRMIGQVDRLDVLRALEEMQR